MLNVLYTDVDAGVEVKIEQGAYNKLICLYVEGAKPSRYSFLHSLQRCLVLFLSFPLMLLPLLPLLRPRSVADVARLRVQELLVRRRGHLLRRPLAQQRRKSPKSRGARLSTS